MFVKIVKVLLVARVKRVVEIIAHKVIKFDTEIQIFAMNKPYSMVNPEVLQNKILASQ
jgi:hypothetical protein